MRLYRGLLVAVAAAVALTAGCQESGTMIIVKATLDSDADLRMVLFVADPSVPTDSPTVWQRQREEGDDFADPIPARKFTNGFRIMINNGDATDLRIAVVAWDAAINAADPDALPGPNDPVWFATGQVNVSSSGRVREYTLTMKSQAFGNRELVVGDSCEVNSNDGVYLHRGEEDTLCLGWQLNDPGPDHDISRGVFLVDALDADCDGTALREQDERRQCFDDALQCDPDVPETAIAETSSESFGCDALNCDGDLPGNPCVVTDEVGHCLGGTMQTCNEGSITDCDTSDDVVATGCPAGAATISCSRLGCSGEVAGLPICTWPLKLVGGENITCPVNFEIAGLAGLFESPCTARIWGSPSSGEDMAIKVMGLIADGESDAKQRIYSPLCKFTVVGTGTVTFGDEELDQLPLMMISVDYVDADLSDRLFSMVLGAPALLPAACPRNDNVECSIPSPSP